MENKKYKIIGEIKILDEKGVETGQVLELDSIQEVPVKLGKEWVKKGVALLVEDKPEDSKVDEKVTSVEVYTKDNQVIRTYTGEMHGKDFVRLAGEFAKKHGYSLK